MLNFLVQPNSDKDSAVPSALLISNDAGKSHTLPISNISIYYMHNKVYPKNWIHSHSNIICNIWPHYNHITILTTQRGMSRCTNILWLYDLMIIYDRCGPCKTMMDITTFISTVNKYWSSCTCFMVHNINIVECGWKQTFLRNPPLSLLHCNFVSVTFIYTC